MYTSQQVERDPGGCRGTCSPGSHHPEASIRTTTLCRIQRVQNTCTSTVVMTKVRLPHIHQFECNAHPLHIEIFEWLYFQPYFWMLGSNSGRGDQRYAYRFAKSGIFSTIVSNWSTKQVVRDSTGTYLKLIQKQREQACGFYQNKPPYIYKTVSLVTEIANKPTGEYFVRKRTQATHPVHRTVSNQSIQKDPAVASYLLGENWYIL